MQHTDEFAVVFSIPFVENNNIVSENICTLELYFRLRDSIKILDNLLSMEFALKNVFIRAKYFLISDLTIRLVLTLFDSKYMQSQRLTYCRIVVYLIVELI